MSESVIDRRIEKMQQALARMQALLADPYPGLVMWMLAVESERERFNRVMDGKEDQP
jgi:hypothetical protein